MDGRLKVWLSKRQELLSINDHSFYLYSSLTDLVNEVFLHYTNYLIHFLFRDMVVGDKPIDPFRVHIDSSDYLLVSKEL